MFKNETVLAWIKRRQEYNPLPAFQSIIPKNVSDKIRIKEAKMNDTKRKQALMEDITPPTINFTWLEACHPPSMLVTVFYQCTAIHAAHTTDTA